MPNNFLCQDFSSSPAATAIAVPSHYKKILAWKEKHQITFEEDDVSLQDNVQVMRRKRKDRHNDVTDDGTTRKLNPTETYWFKNYVKFPNLQCTRFMKRFRSRFRMPYESYLFLRDQISESQLFRRWTNSTPLNNKVKRAPISLLLLGSLRYLLSLIHI